MDVNLPARVKYDKKAVKDFVNRLSDEIDQDAVDATSIRRARASRRRPGRRPAVEKARMTDEITRPPTPGPRSGAPGRGRTTKPDVTTKDLGQAYPRYVYIDRGSSTCASTTI